MDLAHHIRSSAILRSPSGGRSRLLPIVRPRSAKYRAELLPFTSSRFRTVRLDSYRVLLPISEMQDDPVETGFKLSCHDLFPGKKNGNRCEIISRAIDRKFVKCTSASIEKKKKNRIHRSRNSLFEKVISCGRGKRIRKEVESISRQALNRSIDR